MRSLVIAVVGVVFFGGGFLLHRQNSPYSDGITATAKVVDLDAVRDNKGKTSYRAVYNFTTADGKNITFQDPGSMGSQPDIGDEVDVSYRASTPQKAHPIPAFDWPGWLFMSVGVLIFLLGVVRFIKASLRMVSGRS